MLEALPWGRTKLAAELGEAQQGENIKTTTDKGDEGMDTRGGASSPSKAWCNALL